MKVNVKFIKQNNEPPEERSFENYPVNQKIQLNDFDSTIIKSNLLFRKH